MSRNFERLLSRRKRGFTLVEAAAGMAILGTLLVGVVMAGVRLGAQARASEQRIEACRAADEQLQAWLADPTQLPREASGSVTGRSGWSWHTHRLPSGDVEVLGADRVVLEVFAPEAPDHAAARVEVLAPMKKPGDASAPAATKAPPQPNNAPAAPGGTSNETTLGPDTH